MPPIHRLVGHILIIHSSPLFRQTKIRIHLLVPESVLGSEDRGVSKIEKVLVLQSLLPTRELHKFREPINIFNKPLLQLSNYISSYN